MNDPLGVYISIPFCKAKCTYCNFASGVFGVERMQPYVDRVCSEIAESELPRAVDTVFFGGGTPSLLSAPQIRQLFTMLRDKFDVASDAEITLECAPGQLGGETLDELLAQGMNRISFGVQSFVDAEARAVGRLHTQAMCLAEIDRLRAACISNINVDLIAGLPHQTAASWRNSVDAAIASGVPHVSVYMLEVDDESRLGKEMLAEGARYSAGAVPSEDETAEWYGLACDWLAAAGIAQYEISNFARAGFRSRHNVKYWKRTPYAGFGLDAHSMLRAGDHEVRRANTSDLEEYLGGLEDLKPFTMFRLRAKLEPEIEVIGKEQAFEETLFLGLRMNDGVDLNALRAGFSEDLLRGALEALEDIEAAGLIERVAGSVRLTARGRMASNEVFSRLLVPVAV
jgi:oxygen-independent coproporphyrinogen-3 oxidase